MGIPKLGADSGISCSACRRLSVAIFLHGQSWEQFQSIDKDEVRIIRYVCRTFEGVPLVEFMYLVFTRKPGEIKLPIRVRCSIGRVLMTRPLSSYN